MDVIMNMKQPHVSIAYRQRGAVLLIALVVLIAMTLSALALIRSVNTTNLVSGNLAFRESSVLYSERATEHAIAWLVDEANANAGNLGGDLPVQGYLASREDPAAGENWDQFWDRMMVQRYGHNENDPNYPVPRLPSGGRDVNGNQVAYIIQRLCDGTGSSLSRNCSRPPDRKSVV